MGSSPSKYDLRAIRKISQLAAEFDVVHAHGLRAGALACLADTGAAKVVVTLHNKPVGPRAVSLVGSVLLRIIAA
ncbi:glycosyltransferase, partial [Aerococcus sp. UMB8608]|uniref:glycosyltransferase n=1 Tax=Aerococcus sp. UMB8608 TaxID=3046347 RepID=UPI0033056BCF